MTFHDCLGCADFNCLTKITNILGGVGTEEECWEWWLRHIPPSCCGIRPQSQEFLHRGVVRRRIRCPACGKTQGTYDGTPFTTKMTPRQVIFTLYLFGSGIGLKTMGQFAESCSRSISEHVITPLLHLINAHNYEVFASTESDMIQADESAIGARKYNRGKRRRNGGVIWIAGGVTVTKDGVTSMLAHVVKKRDKRTLVPFLEAVASDEATIVTDGWKAYGSLGAGGRDHKVVNHSVEWVNDEGFHTNAIEGAWRHLKKQIKIRWTNVGTEDLSVCNLRVQAGVFFINCSLDRECPLQKLFCLVKRTPQLQELLANVIKDATSAEIDLSDENVPTPKAKQAVQPPAPVKSGRNTKHVAQPAPTAQATSATAEAFFTIQPFQFVKGAACVHKEHGRVRIVTPMARKTVVEIAGLNCKLLTVWNKDLTSGTQQP